MLLNYVTDTSLKIYLFRVQKPNEYTFTTNVMRCQMCPFFPLCVYLWWSGVEGVLPYWWMSSL